MHADTLSHILSVGIGIALMGLTLLDVFLTVLYARIGSGLVSRRLSCWMWWLFRTISKGITVKRNAFLSFCGPVLLVCLVVTWMACLTCGAALVIKPALGKQIRANNGTTPTDFATALYVAGDSLTTVGASDFSPQTPALRLFYTFNSFVGISFLTLTLTYFLEIYNALQRRNTFALKLHLLTAETGDAADLIAMLGPEGHFEIGYTHLVEIAAEATNFKESHHFYPALFYCRFRETHYALSRIALVTLDSVSLIKSALDDDAYGWLKKSAAVEQLWRASTQLLTVLAAGFLPQGLETVNGGEDQVRAAWEVRYQAAVAKFQDAEIKTVRNPEAGAEVYASLRIKWDRYIREFAEHLAHPLGDIDRALTHALSRSEHVSRREVNARLHATG